MRKRSNILDGLNPQSTRLKTGNGGFTTAARPFDLDFDFGDTSFACGRGGGFARALSGEWRALSSALEAHGTGRLPAEGFAVGIGNRDHSIVEGGLHEGDPSCHIPANLLFCDYF